MSDHETRDHQRTSQHSEPRAPRASRTGTSARGVVDGTADASCAAPLGAMGAACVRPVSAKERKLSPAGVRSLTALYGHDAELLQLVSAVQLVREKAAKLVKSADALFKSESSHARALGAFGGALARVADRHAAAGGPACLPPEQLTPELQAVLGAASLARDLGAAEAFAAEAQRGRFAQAVSPALHGMQGAM
eukprot:CAMPEP_0183798952 /NCGR_PEP_ID=MMETSP0803_2-20130417/20260_1 /TAXON_ID=195967 /ORGANISM="Crustomastix stigmata, Strain CCMP3273" /LENGTH=192 /DNA_ID=CAMNT_0026043649 /DNA_START=48 /DNA_END=623 /DNA_ORIENTATION=-